MASDPNRMPVRSELVYFNFISYYTPVEINCIVLK